jgi:KDO2-lipid IV(A) lauroyltransferase
VSYEKLLVGLAQRPLRTRRLLLHLAFMANELGHGHKRLGLSMLFQSLLGAGLKEADRLERELLFQDKLHELELLALKLGTPAGLQADFKSVGVRDENLFQGLSRAQRPIVLAPLHMGVYPLALGGVLNRYFSQRNVVVLRARDDVAGQTTAIRRIVEFCPRLDIVNVNSPKDMRLLVGAHRANAVIICFIDLPRSYGAATEVPFYRAHIQVALGAVRIAQMMNGFIVPMGVLSGTWGDEVVTFSALELGFKDEQEVARAVDAVGRTIEKLISLDPVQWHMWPRIPEYFPPTK